ncbi:MAG: AraC family transcriptional regulator [Clostridia bacterium]|nr:AraC family transcriptional regulator [Clostridia bacterium]
MKLDNITPFVRFVRTEEKIPPGNDFVPLDHRLFYCIGGEGKMSIDGKEITLKKGCLLYWKSGTSYRYITRSAKIIGCNFDFTNSAKEKSIPVPPSRAGLFSKSSIIENIIFEDEEILNSFFLIENAFSLEEKFFELENEFSGKKLYYQNRCSAILTDIFAMAMRLYKIPEACKASTLAEEILTYVRENYSKNITNINIGKHFNYHPNYINKLISEHTGMSLHKYIIGYRINTAISLLQSTDLTISKIAETVGMPDLKHFSKCFKNITGNPPSYYKRK